MVSFPTQGCGGKLALRRHREKDPQPKHPCSGAAGLSKMVRADVPVEGAVPALAGVLWVL